MEGYTKKEWRSLIELFTKHSSFKEMEQLLSLFLTQKERAFLVHRFKIVKALLTTELPQRQIAEEMNVSIAQITAGSNELKRTKSIFKQQLLDRLA